MNSNLAVSFVLLMSDFALCGMASMFLPNKYFIFLIYICFLRIVDGDNFTTAPWILLVMSLTVIFGLFYATTDSVIT